MRRRNGPAHLRNPRRRQGQGAGRPLPFDGGAPSIDVTLYDIHERKEFKVCDYLVIRWCGGNLLASPYFPRTGGMLVDWIDPAKAEAEETIVDVKVGM